jgi:hypothetical protein
LVEEAEIDHLDRVCGQQALNMAQFAMHLVEQPRELGPIDMMADAE